MGEISSYKITGNLVDSNHKSLKGVLVEATNGDKTISNSRGGYSLMGEIDSDVKIQITFKIDNYTPITKTPYDGNGELKNNMGVIELSSNIQSQSEDKHDLEKQTSQTLKINTPNPKEGVLQSTLNKTSSKIIKTLIPTILTLLTSFGISKALEYIKGQNQEINPKCPSSTDQLLDIINKRNKLVKQLNNIYKIINSAITTIEVLEGIIITFQTLFTILKFIPIPTPPPGAPSLVPPIQDIKPVIEKNIEKFSKINSGTLILLILLRDNLQTALNLLALLDKQIQSCSTDSDLETINEELLNITKEQTLQGNIPPQDVNGFTFDIETENTNNTLKRKRAIAKNKQGVILLRGEYSYSAISQILIDELAFYIQTNNLKAD